ncbi:MAG: AAA family ATPase [Candidatus Cloacimonadota bacterium]|nr:MAG: AAA family ATPase [Candidatus Cloacimonadota bacterium]PIE82024.1 MAG: AAA family ATPase [Candidatus Delongbacteria bacterium]
MKKLGLGIQELSELRKHNRVYVDKTKIIKKLIENEKYCFLSRPRRFGKSLLVNTIDELFSGNKDLFKDTWIYDKWNFEERFPVIKISLSGIGLDTYTLPEALDRLVSNIAKKYNIKLEERDYSVKFQELIQKLSKTNPVAILIDEYDKPIIDYITDIKTAEKNREILKKFYSVVKDLDKHIKLLFITGVSKFSRVSFFSELNNLTDITIKKQYADITGYSEKEIEDNYREYLAEIEDEFNLDRKGLMNLIKLWYNGYSWDGKTFVYNPYSVISFLNDREFKNFWFKSGTATFLLKLIRERGIDVKEYDKGLLSVTEEALDSYNIENINMTVLLFQAGYLTIKSKEIDKYNYSLSYNLGYPNLEVRRSFYLFLGSELAGVQVDIHSSNMRKILSAFRSNDMELFIKVMRSIFASIPDNLSSGRYESYYHTVIYLILMFIGTDIKVEEKTNKGVIDAVVKTENYIYIMEFKMSSAKSAMDQIKSKKYYEKYLTNDRDIICVGIAFSKEDRNVDDFIVMGLDEIR